MEHVVTFTLAGVAMGFALGFFVCEWWRGRPKFVELAQELKVGAATVETNFVDDLHKLVSAREVLVSSAKPAEDHVIAKIDEAIKDVATTTFLAEAPK